MAYIFVNPNPENALNGDCTVRALCLALQKPWHEVYLGLCAIGFELCDMPSSNRVWGQYLLDKGFIKHMLPDACPNCYSIRDFCLDHPSGVYVLGTGSHVVAVIEGDYYDTWNSGDEQPLYFFKKED